MPDAAPHALTLAPAVFLDRDDTLINTHEVTAHDVMPGDLNDPAKVRLMPGVADALVKLKKAGFVLVIFTSQGAVARGNATLAQMEAVNDRLRQLLAEATGDANLIAGTYACPYHPTGTVPFFAKESDWRKPHPGMILTAAKELGLDLASSWAIGDKPRDVEAGQNAGLKPGRCLLLATSGERGPFADMPAAARHVLELSNAR
jgi:D-glycero-D-manno-heptose 1,7-bisphosphate phosphatase